MKKILFLFIATMMAVGAMAQMPQFNPEDMVKRQVDQMKEKCSLTDDQYKAVYALQLANMQKMMAEMDSVRQAGGDMRGAFDREKMQKRNEELNNAIKAVLSEDQYKAYEELQAERRKRFRNFGGGGF